LIGIRWFPFSQTSHILHILYYFDQYGHKEEETEIHQNNDLPPGSVQVLPSGDGDNKMAELRLMLDMMLNEKIDKVTGLEVIWWVSLKSLFTSYASTVVSSLSSLIEIKLIKSHVFFIRFDPIRCSFVRFVFFHQLEDNKKLAAQVDELNVSWFYTFIHLSFNKHSTVTRCHNS